MKPAPKSIQQQFVQAILGGELAAVRSLLQEGWDPNFQVNVEDSDFCWLANGGVIGRPYSGTPLHISLVANDRHAARLLLQCGLHDQPDSQGYWHIHRAAYGGDAEIVKMLLRSGSNVNQEGLCRPNHTLSRPLNEAIRDGSRKMVELLIEAGADIHVGIGDEPNPLWTPTENAEIQDVLLDAGCDPYACNTYGMNYPTYLSKIGANHKIRRLLMRGIDFNRAGLDGQVPMDVVNPAWTVRLLIAAGVPVSQKALARITPPISAVEHADKPLYQAIMIRDPQLVIQALERGEDPRQELHPGKTVLERAQEIAAEDQENGTSGAPRSADVLALMQAWENRRRANEILTQLNSSKGHAHMRHQSPS